MDSSYTGGLINLFGQYDEDGSGAIEITEFNRLWVQLGQAELPTSVGLQPSRPPTEAVPQKTATATEGGQQSSSDSKQEEAGLLRPAGQASELAPAAPAPAMMGAGAVEVELRLDAEDGQAYSHGAFVAHYGEEDGNTRWATAGAVAAMAHVQGPEPEPPLCGALVATDDQRSSQAVLVPEEQAAEQAMRQRAWEIYRQAAEVGDRAAAGVPRSHDCWPPLTAWPLVDGGLTHDSVDVLPFYCARQAEEVALLAELGYDPENTAGGHGGHASWMDAGAPCSRARLVSTLAASVASQSATTIALSLENFLQVLRRCGGVLAPPARAHSRLVVWRSPWLAEEAVRAAAATTLQSVFRGWRARRELGVEAKLLVDLQGTGTQQAGAWLPAGHREYLVQLDRRCCGGCCTIPTCCAASFCRQCTHTVCGMAPRLKSPSEAYLPCRRAMPPTLQDRAARARAGGGPAGRQVARSRRLPENALGHWFQPGSTAATAAVRSSSHPPTPSSFYNSGGGGGGRGRPTTAARHSGRSAAAAATSTAWERCCGFHPLGGGGGGGGGTARGAAGD